MAAQRNRGEELTPERLRKMVIQEECRDCDAGINFDDLQGYHKDSKQRGKGCIHYLECTRIVRKRYMQGSDAAFDPPN